MRQCWRTAGRLSRVLMTARAEVGAAMEAADRESSKGQRILEIKSYDQIEG